MRLNESGLGRALAASRRARLLLALITGLLTMGAVASSAFATEGIQTFEVTSSSNAAGGHPDLETSFSLESPGEPETARDVVFDAPTGVFGNANAIGRCSSTDFVLTRCPSNSQAGLITVRANYEGDPNYLLGTVPIYDMETSAHTALFAFDVPVLNIPIQIPVAVRTGSDYGLRFTVQDISQLTPLSSANLTFWGFPAAATHNSQRFPKGSPGHPPGCVGSETTSCLGGSTPAAITVHPMIDNPTTCSGQELESSLEVQTYQDPEHTSTSQSSYPAVEECENVTFKPVLYASPTTEETDSASGLNVDLSDPQPLGVAVTPSEMKSVTVTLPPGLTINPDAADGQSACKDAQANFHSEGPDECPDSAKIGSFSIGSQALDDRLEGSVYIGEPQPGNEYRLFMMASGFGINAKLIGSARPDPATGQLTVYFENLPQAPFDDLQLHLFAGERALMATPIGCTIYPVEADFIPWSESVADQRSSQDFSLSSGPHQAACPGDVRPFAPTLAAGTSDPTAGAFSSFYLKLDREDGDQFLGDLNFKMPPGFTGDLRGISYCPESSIATAIQNSGREEQANPSCPASSQIGTTNVAAGPGSHPFHSVGKMYLAGPFKGAPLSLAAVTPALAGPYDYGVVVVRVALHVDPETAQVSAVSDTVPSIIGGIPIRMRSIQVNLDKPNFTINPTNCSPMAVDSQGIGDQGTVAAFSSYFHAVNCSTLGFKPRMKIAMTGGRRQIKRASNPTLRFDLNTRAGDGNIKSIGVTLPKAFEIDQEHLGNICTEKLLVETQCAGKQQIGEAFTETPLLDEPLKGPVYAVSGSGGLPRLAFILNGQVDLLPRADTKTVAGGRLQTTVPVVPDAPIGHFHLVIFGGKHGYLANTRSLCAGKAPAIQVAYTAQNEASLTQAIRIKAPCGNKGKARHKRHAR